MAEKDETNKKIQKQQKGHSELLASVKSSISKLESRGKVLVVENLPLEKQIAPLNFFFSVSPAGGLTCQCSEEFLEDETLKQLGEAMMDCTKDYQNSRIRSRAALHASGKPIAELNASLLDAKKRKPSRTTILQKGVQSHFKSKLQPQCDAAFQVALVEKCASGAFVWSTTCHIHIDIAIL